MQALIRGLHVVCARPAAAPGGHLSPEFYPDLAGDVRLWRYTDFFSYFLLITIYVF